MTARTISLFLRSQLFLRSLALSLLIPACAVLAQRGQSDPVFVRERIQQEVKDLDAAQQKSVPNRELAFRWMKLGTDYESSADFTNAERAYNRSLQLLSADPATKSPYADVLDRLGHLEQVYGHVEEARNCRLKALALRQQLGDSLGIARSQGHLAEIALTLRKYKQAASDADRAYQSLIQLNDPQKTDLVSNLVVLAYARCSYHDCEHGLADARQAVAISHGAFPPDSLPAGATLQVLGFAQWKSGAAADAEATTQEALRILKVQLAPDDPRLIRAVEQYRDCLLAQHKKHEAREVDAQLSTTYRQSSQSCAGCSVSVFGLAAPVH